MSSDFELNIRINADASGATQGFQEAGEAAKQMSGDMDEAGRSAERSGKSMGSAASGLAGLAAAGASLIGLVRSLDQVENASHRAERAQHALERSNAAVATAQQKYNQAVAQFGSGSAQAQAALGELNRQLDRNSDFANRAADAQENIGFAMGNAATSILNFGAGISTIVGNLGAFKNALSKIGPALSGLSGAGLLGSIGAIAAPLLAATAAGTAFAIAMEKVKQAVGLGGFSVIPFEQMDAAIRKIPEVGPIIADAAKGFRDWVLGTKEAGNASNEMGQSAEQMAAAMAAASAEAQTAFKPFGSAFSGIVEDARKAQEGTSTEIEKIKQKMRDLQSGFVIEAPGGGRKIDWEKVFEFEKLQSELKTKLGEVGNTFASELSKLFDRPLPASLATFGDRIADSLPSNAEVSAMMGLLGQGIQQGGSGMVDAINFILTEMNEEWDQMPAPAREAVSELDTELRKLASLTPGTPAFFNQLAVVEEKFNNISNLKFDGSGLSAGFVATQNAAAKAAPEVEKFGKAVTDTPTDHVTTMTANTFNFTGPVSEASTAIKTIPDNKNTTVAAQGVAAVTAGAQGIAESFSTRAGYPDNKNTLVTAGGIPLVLAGAQAVGKAFAAPTYPDNKNTQVTAGGVPLVLAGAQAIGKAFAAPTYPDNKNTAVTANGMSVVEAGAQAIGKAFSAPAYPNDKNTKVTETGGSIVESVAKSVGQALGLIPPDTKTDLKAIDQASAKINTVKSGLDTIPSSKTVKITVSAHAGAGMSAQLKASLGLTARHGLNTIVSNPTRVLVGEGFHPEMVTRMPVHMAAKGFGPEVIAKPTMFMAGERGPELVNVVPLAKGTQGGGGADINRLIALFEKYVHMQRRSMEANLIVDGQRMANVAEKYIGNKGYGDH
jgi:hypothetical protein